MKRDELDELHYITAIANLPSILHAGILSHARAQRVPHRSVAMQEVQDRRAAVRVPRGRPLHEYVNLYLCARNPMLYKRLGMVDSLCVLRVSTAVLDLPSVVITDGNAASGSTAFHPSPSGLAKIERDMVFAEYWTDGNGIANWEKKRVKCAEALVPDRVDPQHILGARVRSQAVRSTVATLAPGLAVAVDPKLFFA